MRTFKEIQERCNNTESFFGFDVEVLILYLPYRYAKSFLKEGVTSNEWEKDCYIKLKRDTVLKEMKEYMEFAWGKIEDHRGLSASRSIEKMEAWVWLLGDDKVLGEMKAVNYKNYGAPKLKVICDAYGFFVPQNIMVQNMIKSLRCLPDCNQGCE